MSRSRPSLGNQSSTDWPRRLAAEQASYAKAAQGLADELEAAGFTFDRLRDLQLRTLTGHRALPALLTWLPRARHPDLKVDIALALGARWAVPHAFEPLVREYHRTTNPDFESGRIRGAICTTLERIAEDSIAGEVLSIAKDSTFGVDRGMSIVALGNLVGHRGEAVEALAALLDETDVTLFAILGLAKLGATEFRAAVSKQRGHRNPIVRHTARQTVQRWMIDERRQPVRVVTPLNQADVLAPADSPGGSVSAASREPLAGLTNTVSTR